jgi:uncharacterized protein YoxC
VKIFRQSLFKVLTSTVQPSTSQIHISLDFESARFQVTERSTVFIFKLVVVAEAGSVCLTFNQITEYKATMTDLSTSSDQLVPEAAIGANSPSEDTSTMESTSTPTVSEASQIEAERLAAWMRDQARIAAFFNEPGLYIGQFWQRYKPIFALIGYAIVALIAINLVLTIVGFIISIPLVGSLLELIGIGYSIWFANRYVLTAEKRQELGQKFEQIKQDIFGSNNNVANVANAADTVQDSVSTVSADAEEISDPMLVNSL